MNVKHKLVSVRNKVVEEVCNPEMVMYFFGVAVGTTIAMTIEKRRRKVMTEFVGWIASATHRVPEGVKQEIWTEGNMYYIKKASE